MSKPKLLITGAAGRVGTLLRPLLSEKYDLRLVDLAPIQDTEPGEEAIQGDLADQKLAEQAVSGTVGVIHLAAVVSPSLNFADSFAPNYQAVLNLLEACRQSNVSRFVFASSHHAVGLLPSTNIASARTLPAPDGFYGLSKAFGEAACAMYAYRFGIQTLVVRIGNADPEVVDGRRERIWTSGNDLVRLIEIGLTTEELVYEVVYGISHCPQPLLKNDSTEHLGYVPQDFASQHRSPHFRPLDSLGREDGIDYIGGLFAVTPLPDPTETI